MDASDITDALFRYFRAGRGYTYQLANAYVFKWESDFFCIASSGYSYEIEVKVSRSDYKADFKKTERHRILGWEGKVYTKRRSIVTENPAGQYAGASYKNGLYYRGRYGHRPPRSAISFVELGQVCPNKFLFACPEGMIQPEEVPRYAGLIYVKDDRRYKPKIIKRPPALHRFKKDFTKILLKKYYWAYLNSLDKPNVGKNFEFPNENKLARTR